MGSNESNATGINLLDGIRNTPSFNSEISNHLAYQLTNA